MLWRRHFAQTGARLGLGVFAFSFALGDARADAVSDFYAGKTMTIVVGADSGGGYDAQGRLMSRHIGKFIPGNPTVIVQNMPGAGSLTAANQLYNVSPKDGTMIGLLQRGVFSAKFTNPQGVRFDLAKFNWVGNLSSETAVVIAWAASPFQKIEDVMAKEMLVGGTGPHIDTETTPRMLNALIGTKFKIISGYPGTTEAVLAMERGEVQGMGDWSWSNVKTRKPDFLRDKKIRVLLQVATEKMPDLQDVPLAMDYVKTPADREVMELFLAQKSAARPVVAPPGIPAERIAAIRAGFDKMIASEEFLKDAHAAKLEVEPAPAAAIEKVIKLFAATSEATGQRLKDAIDPKK